MSSTWLESSTTSDARAASRGEPAPPVEEEPIEPIERTALRFAALLGRG